MNWETYLDELYHSGITLWPDGDDLLVEGQAEALTPAHLQTLKTHKHDLLHFLRHATTHYPLSSGQQGLWFEHQMMADGFAYNVSLPLHIHSVVKPATLQQAFQLLINRHPALRTTFPLVEGQPVQQVHRYQEVILKEIDATLWTEQELKERVRATHELPFDLAQGPLFRLSLFTRQADDHVLLFTLHHLICDGWSLWLMLDELRTLYTAVLADEPAELPALQSTYSDYVAWQARILEENEQRLWDYWKNVLAGELPLLNLPTDQPRSAVRTYQGASLPLLIPENLTRQLTALARRCGVTLYMMLLAAFQILLQRYTGQDDILVGSPTAGQRRAELASIVGYFISPVVMRADLSANLSFREFLGQVRETVLGAFEHQDFPFPLLVQRLQSARTVGAPTIYQAMFALQKPQTDPQLIEVITTATTEPFGELHLSSFPLPQYQGQFDVFLELFDTPTVLTGTLKYNPDLFTPAAISRMASHFETLLEGIVANPEGAISDLPILTQAERHQLLVEWNDTAADYPKQLCIHQLFEQQVERTPDAIAVMFENEQLSYTKLNQRANQLAHWLKKQGIGSEMMVGLYIERSIEAIIGVLGILKSGAAYVPLDPALPSARIATMMQAIGRPMVVTLEGLPDSLLLMDINVVSVARNRQQIESQPRHNLSTLVTARNLAYVIYTSGSTGQPNGVEVEHRSLINYVEQIQKEFNLGPGDRSLLFASLSFDTSIQDIFVALTAGLTLHLRTPEMLNSVAHFLTCCREWGLTYIAMPTAYWHEIVAYLSDEAVGEKTLPWPTQLRACYVGGEKFQPVKLATWHQLMEGRVRLVNGYGPTETAIACTLCDLTNVGHLDGEVPIGRPIQNMQAYILDSYLNPVPVGVPGELHIGGIGLARGYLNQPTLTAQKFIQNPFGDEHAPRLYKTGDLARYWPDGRIEYLGRTDSQVKIRGFRIELGEIESKLLTQDGVNEAVVLAREDNPENKRLVAYIVGSRQLTVDSEEEATVASRLCNSETLRQTLGQQLPDYMIPSAFVFLDAMPLTPNGKIDRRALPAPTWQSQTTYVAPQNEVERQVAALWQEVLSVEKAGPEQYNISVHDNFFELGGHSLLIIQLHNRLREIYEQEDGSFSIAITDLFKYPTVHTFARHLSKQLYTSPKLTLARLAAISAAKIFKPITESREFRETPIAIIGMSCRFPDANGVDAFWENLRQGKESISFFSDEELLAAGVDPSLLSDPNYVKAGTVLPDTKLFDATFFGFSPREAEMLDPQQRLFLECAWEAIESAGYPQEQEQAAIGVYAGVGINSYLRHNLYPNRELVESVGEYQLMLNNDKDFLPTRVSYKLNLTGPSVNVQTACSTSLVAVHLACQSLRHYECDMALAGGASVQVPQKRGYLYKQGMILSPDGHCRAFDAQAQGTVGGQGVGIVVLKRLESAIKDGDTIHAVIKGSAINNDGSLKVSYTAPSVNGQAKVIRDAQAVAGVAPETITCIEAHGTGTVLGDPIEIAALTEAFQTEKRAYCAIGSVKSNIGHTDTAAGVAGLIKTVLALKHRLIPPSLHFETPNPKIDFANSPFYVNTELSDWKPNGLPRRAGVSSFGIGGTNAHLVLEEAPPRDPSGDARPWQLLLLSAKTLSALDTATTNLAQYLTTSDQNLADVACTLAKGRRRFPYRRMLVCQTVDEAISSLSEGERLLTGFYESKERPIAFMFPGQGTQYVNMGRELYEVEPTFREAVDRCVEILKPILGLDLRDLLMASQERTLEATHQLEQTAITQPALFVIEYALAQLWRSWGVTPQAMIGHSIGEYVAATLAGVFSLPDALKLVAVRGQLMQSLPKGAMLAVSLPKEKLALGDDSLARLPVLGRPKANKVEGLGVRAALSLAAINGPSLCVVSGSPLAIEAYQKQLTAQQVACRRLHTSHAFHSAMMEPILAAFTEQVQAINLQPPQIPVISNVTGTWITAEEATNPTYWAKHLRQTIHFASGLGELLKEPELILLEVGPGRTLSTLAKAQPDRTEQVVLHSLPHAREKQSDSAYLLTTLGRLFIAGGAIDWDGFYAHERRHRLPLPTYPFERQSYWIEPPQGDVIQSQRGTKPKKQEIADWFYRPSWERSPLPISPQSESSGLGLNEESVLLFVDECGLGDQLAKRLKKEGQDVITVSRGSGFTKLDDQTYLLNPERRDEYDALLQDILRQGKRLSMIVHLWRVTSSATRSSLRQAVRSIVRRRAASRSSVKTEPEQAITLQSTEAGLKLGFYSLLFLAQALCSITEQIQLMVVTNNMQDVTGEERLCPEKATILGPVKVIPQEYPNIRTRTIDVVVGNQVSADSTVVNQLLAELNSSLSGFKSNDRASTSSQVIAYRGRYRWEQTFKPIQLHKTEPTKSLIREGGVYLITGGLGGIGLVLAEELARKNAKLILIGRSAFPEREEWARFAWLTTHDENDQVSHKIRKVQALEELGAQVLVMSADVANQKQMQAVINQAKKTFGQLNGVIHAAGAVKDSFNLIQQISPTECQTQFRPKVDGLLVLEKVLQGQALDFCVLLSSLSSVLGGLGFVAYSAANLFMDAFTYQHNREHSIRWRSVNWDGWRLQEEEHDTSNTFSSSFGASLAKFAITPKEGVKAFRLLTTFIQDDQVVVSTGELQARIDKWINFETEEQPSSTPVVKSLSSHARPTLQSAYVAPRNETEQVLAEIYQNLLGIERVGIHDDFFELGGHSLLATQLIFRLQTLFRVTLPLQKFFEGPTVSGLAEALAELWGGREIVEEIAQTWQEVAQLSEEETKKVILKS